MNRPSCFKKGFSTESKFCMEVCKHAAECGGVLADERKKMTAEYHKGSMPFKQLVEERFAILKDEIAARKSTLV
jgi:hypothetical protein